LIGQHSVGARLCAKRQPQRVASVLRLVFDTAALQSGEKCKLISRHSSVFGISFLCLFDVLFGFVNHNS